MAGRAERKTHGFCGTARAEQTKIKETGANLLSLYHIRRGNASPKIVKTPKICAGAAGPFRGGAGGPEGRAPGPGNGGRAFDSFVFEPTFGPNSSAALFILA